MQEKEVVERAKEDLNEGKSASTAAGEFVHAEIEHVREGKHGVRSPQQAIAIGLSEARRAGVPVKPAAKGKTNESTRHTAIKDLERGKREPLTSEGDSNRSKTRVKALQREPKSSVSHAALSRHAKAAAKKRTSKG